MATIQLNLQLTDEQYQNLMSSSLDKVVSDEETVKALRETVVAQMASYLTNNTSIIKDMFYDHNAFGWECGVSGSTKHIIKEAAAGAAKQLEDAVSSYMMDLAKQQNMEAIIQQILVKAVLEGAVSGLANWRDMITSEILHTDCEIRDVKSRLGMTDGC